MEKSSLSVGARQSSWPASSSDSQYSIAACQVKLLSSGVFCQVRPVLLSVTVPSPLSV